MFKKIASLVLIISIVFVNFGFMTAREAMAANLTVMSDTLSNVTAAAVANHTIVFTTPTGVASGATIILTFDNSTNTGSVAPGDIDLQDDAVDVPLAAAPSGATWGVVRTSNTVITFTNGTTVVAPASVITIKIGTNATSGGTGTNQITNGTAGTTTLRISGTFGDTGTMAMFLIANGIVSVSAQVLSTISFTISANAIYFGILRSSGNTCWAQNTDPGNVSCPTIAEAEAFNMTAGTNGTSGYTVSVQGPTLTSGANTIPALGSNTAPSIGTEQFGLRMTAAGGTGSVSAPYAASGYAYTATANTSAPVASAASASATTTYSVRYMANISPITKAGNYTASHYYVATGNF